MVATGVRRGKSRHFDCHLMRQILNTELSDDDIKYLSILFERLGAVHSEFEYCQTIFASSPDRVEQLKQDAAAVINMQDRIELWVTGTPPIKRF